MVMKHLPLPPPRHSLPRHLAPRADDVMRVVGICTHIAADDFTNRSRKRHVARPRQMAMALLHEMTALSLPQMGRKFGGLDHTTILHGVRRVHALCREDRDFAARMRSVRRATLHALRQGEGLRLPPGELARRVKACASIGRFCFLLEGQEAAELRAANAVARFAREMGRRHTRFVHALTLACFATARAPFPETRAVHCRETRARLPVFSSPEIAA